MTFKEDFLQLVWKYQYFEKADLKTSDAQVVKIIKVGFHNLTEGPDFRDAMIELDGVTFHGHVEVHKFASEWKQHAHSSDPAYNSVILHVVWKNDKKVLRNDETEMPTIELDGRIFLEIWRRYDQLLDFNEDLPCAHALGQVPEIIRFSALEKALVGRLHEKSQLVLNILEQTNNDWEETAYRWLFVSFGFKLNAEAMKELASLVPYKILLKYRNQLPALEAILFGVAGLIPEQSDEPYVHYLKSEYQFYQKKHQWSQKMIRSHWNFMGARPSNFPTIRIAQLTSILSKAPNLLESVIEESRDFSAFKKLLQVQPSEYWEYHYSFGSESKRKVSKGISEQVLNLLIINFVIPIWFAYGRYFQNSEWQERCFDLLQEVSAESNFIVRKFFESGWKPHNSFDTQGMIGLFRNYCTPKKCLTCKVAQSLIRSENK